MASKRRRPQPGGDCGASEKVLASGFDFLRFNPQNHKKQPRPRRRRQHRKVLQAYQP